MQSFFLAILIWAVQLKALPSNISHGHADEELTQSPELAALAPRFNYPWMGKQPYRELSEAQTVCEHNGDVWSDKRFAPLVRDCEHLRDEIAANPGLWSIHYGDWDHRAWRLLRTRIAEYETCEIFLWSAAEMGFFFGSGDAIKALDTAIANGGVGIKTKPLCDSKRDVSVYVYHKDWPFHDGWKGPKYPPKLH